MSDELVIVVQGGHEVGEFVVPPVDDGPTVQPQGAVGAADEEVPGEG